MMTSQYPISAPAARVGTRDSLTTNRVLVAHAVLWIGLGIAVPLAGIYSDELVLAVFGVLRWTPYIVSLVALVTLPVALAVITLGRDLGRTFGALALVLLGCVLFTVLLRGWRAFFVLFEFGGTVPIVALCALVATGTGAWLVARRQGWISVFWGVPAGGLSGLLLAVLDASDWEPAAAGAGQAVAILLVATVLPACAAAWAAALTERVGPIDRVWERS